MNLPTSHRVRARGLGFGVLEWGQPRADRPSIVVFHGWLDQAMAWHRVARALVDQGRHVIAWDHRGHGTSDHGAPSSGYHFAEYIADADALFDALKLDGAVLVGHSMGGTMAGMFAGLRPQRVSAAVLVDGLGPPATADADAVDQLVAFLDAQRRPPVHRALGSLDDARVRIQRVNPGLPDDLARALAQRSTRSEGLGTVSWSWDARHRSRSAIAYDRDRHLLVLARICAPVALVYGEDGWYPKLDDLGAREAAIPTVVSRHNLPCGHAVHLEQPERLAEIIDRAGA